MAVLKWSGIVVATLVLGLLALRVLYGLIANPGVMEEITANPNGERAGIVMALTLPDGRTLPVNYRREGNHVYAGADGRWWRTLRDGNAPVTVLIRGETLTGSRTRGVRRPGVQGGCLQSSATDGAKLATGVAGRTPGRH